ncbi:MAG TPA: response regulator transcription factor [Phaeodactylibacter sp.]|nr:response regulator transcription factor [Phaeodactylibacter sp.]
MKLLLSSARTGLQSQLLGFFKRQGWRCELAPTPAAFWRKTNAYDYEVLLVDQQLSGQAERWAQLLRREACNSAMVLLTNEDEVDQRIAALQAGYDEVVRLPMHLGELKARIQAILRRQASYPQPDIALGALRLLSEERRLEVDGQWLELTKKEFDLLHLLARHGGRVATKAHLVEYLWGEDMEEAASYGFLYAHIKNLRRKLKEAGVEGLIESVYGLGYKLSV